MYDHEGYATAHHDHEPAREPERRGGVSTFGVMLRAMAVGSLLLMAVAGFMTYRWMDRNLLHWGMQDQPIATVNQADLLRQVQAFELSTVKRTYRSEAKVDAGKNVNAGPVRFSLPGWAAGQSLTVKGNVVVAAGVDLANVRPEDMQVSREGKDTHVTIHVPAPQVMSTELVTGTLDMSTKDGMINRAERSIGLSGGPDLRDRAADEVTKGARDTALRDGILNDAAREAERRLSGFLNTLPKPTGAGTVTYTVVVKDPVTQ